MKKLNIIALLLLLSISSIFAQIPVGYYNNAENKAGADLKSSLHTIIKVGTRLDYGSGEGATWWGFSFTDRHPDGHVWDMYSNNKVPFNGYSAASGMNIEHSFAKSWWGSSKNNAYKDLFHLNPSNSTANSARGSWPPGIVDGEGSWNNGSFKVGDNAFGDYYGKCFEPDDEYKGDFARAYMYMITCYQDLNLTSSENARTAIISDAAYKYTFKTWFRDLMLKWHREDPVSQKEMTRQLEIHKIQKNRNPFIDYPLLAEHLWGTMIGQAWNTSGSVDIPYISSPFSNSTVEFASTPVYMTTSDTVIVKGQNLESNLTVSITGANASCFTTDVTTVTPTEAHSESGKMVIIRFTPDALNNLSAKLNITGGGLANSIYVNLQGEGTNEFKAVDATNITPEGFTANWSMDFGAEEYLVNVYTYIDNGEVGEVEIFNTTFTGGSFEDGVRKESGYSAFENDALRMASGSQACVISLPTMDLSSDNVMLTVNAKQYNNDYGAKLTVKVDTRTVGEFTTSETMEKQSLNIGGFNATSTVYLSVESGKRVYLSDINIIDQGNILSKDTLDGYPVKLGDVRNHNITVPNFANTDYYYTITSLDNNGEELNTSNEVRVSYIQTNNDLTESNEIICYRNGSELIVTGIQSESTINMYSINGSIVKTVQTTRTTNINIDNLSKGIYILRISNDNNSKAIKVIL